MVKLLVAGALAGIVLSGCGVAPATQGESAPGAAGGQAAASYRCEQEIAFTVRFLDDSAVVDAGSRGKEVLLRDAGGVTPQQSVYSNPRLRAEFGLGAGARGATLHYLSSQQMAQCVRD
jgi:hypothetical protein